MLLSAEVCVFRAAQRTEADGADPFPGWELNSGYYKSLAPSFSLTVPGIRLERSPTLSFPPVASLEAVSPLLCLQAQTYYNEGEKF